MKRIYSLFLLFFFSVYESGDASDSLVASSRISAAGMQAQNNRLKVIAQNLANIDVTGRGPDEDPYRRKIIFFKNEFDEKKGAEVVKVDGVYQDQSDFIKKYEPSHPAADSNGYVSYPNVNMAIETIDAKEAQRSFEANLSALEIAKSNQSKILELMK